MADSSYRMPEAGRVYRTASTAVTTSFTTDALEYGLAKTALDFGVGFVEGFIGSIVSSVAGSTITRLGLQIVNNTFSYGLMRAHPNDV